IPRMTERKLKPTRVSKIQTIILRQVIVIPPSPTGGFECLIMFPILACCQPRLDQRNVVATLAGNTFQRRRFASQMKPIQDCHPERSEGSLSGERSFAALRMTKRDGLLFEMYCPLRSSWGGAPATCLKLVRIGDHQGPPLRVSLMPM